MSKTGSFLGKSGAYNSRVGALDSELTGGGQGFSRGQPKRQALITDCLGVCIPNRIQDGSGHWKDGGGSLEILLSSLVAIGICDIRETGTAGLLNTCMGPGAGSQGSQHPGHRVRRHFLNTNCGPDTGQERQIQFSKCFLLVRRDISMEISALEKEQAENRGTGRVRWGSHDT